MSTPLGFALNVVAVTILVFGLYFPRHRRKDLVVSYLGVNIGVLAFAEASCRSSGSGRSSSTSKRSPTTSWRWRSACSAACRSRRRGWLRR